MSSFYLYRETNNDPTIFMPLPCLMVSGDERQAYDDIPAHAEDRIAFTTLRKTLSSSAIGCD